jgi:hypothetical protein
LIGIWLIVGFSSPRLDPLWLRESVGDRCDQGKERQLFFPAAVTVLAQEGLTIKGAGSPACFFARLATFFSLGVSMACFFDSLLDRCGLVMVFTPLHAVGIAENGCGMNYIVSARMIRSLLHRWVRRSVSSMGAQRRKR